MLEWFQHVMNSWQYIFVYGLTDWLTDNFTAPLLGRAGPMGAYLNNGLNFAAKQAVPATSYFSGIGGSVMGMFGKKP